MMFLTSCLNLGKVKILSNVAVRRPLDIYVRGMAGTAQSQTSAVSTMEVGINHKQK